MSIRVQEVKLGEEQRKVLSTQLGTLINDEIVVLESLIKSYSNSPYMMSKMNELITDSVKRKILEFCKHLPYVGINAILVFRRNPVVTNIITNEWYFGTTVNIHYHGENTIAEISHVDMKDTMVNIPAPMDKWNEVGIVQLDAGPYGMILINNVFVIIEEEDENEGNVTGNESTGDTEIREPGEEVE